MNKAHFIASDLYWQKYGEQIKQHLDMHNVQFSKDGNKLRIEAESKHFHRDGMNIIIQGRFRGTKFTVKKVIDRETGDEIQVGAS